METREIVEELDKEIARLQEVRKLLSGGSGGIPSSKRAGRKKRVLSAEARARIAAAQRARWAKQKRS